MLVARVDVHVVQDAHVCLHLCRWLHHLQCHYRLQRLWLLVSLIHMRSNLDIKAPPPMSPCGLACAPPPIALAPPPPVAGTRF